MFADLVKSEFQPYGALSPTQVEQLEAHYKLLLAWNKKLNLTRITDPVEAATFHYCESLLLGTLLPAGRLRVGDLGSGAGFPGIPIAILRPELQLTLIESDQRKAVFLRESVRTLPNVAVIAARFEAIADRFDWVVARAVAPVDVLKSGLAPNFALLLGPSDISSGSEVVRMPWGRDRFASVSRETG